ncbi:MAG: HPr family phosphocarrier protein [Candidatus Omnitrophica bacterium]|nr:HPr family phosphocarrier protein [Candidatus Omnitrophota bacterium]
MERIKEQVVVGKVHGLHARPATIFVQLANKFNSSVKIERGGEIVDGKSIMALLSLGVNAGTKVDLIVEGDDAREAMDDLKKFLEDEDKND